VMRQDVTAQKREKQRLLRLSQVDALTGLTNRAGFLQKLNDSMAYCRESASMMAVMYLDIDRFKPVNDTYGHAVGDALLKAFSARLSHTLRASDTVARLGGDEFTIIMERISKAEDAMAAAAKIVAAMQATFELEGIPVNVSTSIGLTFYRDEELSPAELLKRADVLLYEAKQAGRNTYRSPQCRIRRQSALDQTACAPDALYCALPTRSELPCVCCTPRTGTLASHSIILTVTTSTSVFSTGCWIPSSPNRRTRC